MTVTRHILKKQSKGFSLVEILVVISIIGIFSAIGIASFQGTSQGTKFAANKISLSQTLNDYRYKAFVENKPYVLQIYNNTTNDVIIDLIEPDSINWRDKNKMRRCNCQMGGTSGSECDQAFTQDQTGQTPIQTKTIEQFKIKLCNEDCAAETENTVKICYLQDGTSPNSIFFKIHNVSNSINSTMKINQTGYVE